jgi:hypothetical protein
MAGRSIAAYVWWHKDPFITVPIIFYETAQELKERRKDVVESRICIYTVIFDELFLKMRSSEKLPNFSNIFKHTTTLDLCNLNSNPNLTNLNLNLRF